MQMGNNPVINIDLNPSKYNKKYHNFILDLQLIIENLTLVNVREFINLNLLTN